MEILSPSWFSELAMEDPISMGQCDIMDSFDEDFTTAFGDFQNSLFPQFNSTLCVSSSLQAPQHNVGLETQRPTEHKPSSFNQYSSTPIILDFSGKSGAQKLGGTINIEDDVFIEKDGLVGRDDNDVPKDGQVNKKSGWRTRLPSQIYDHIIAERKRREKLSEQFIALSSIMPGLKKRDKTYVLGEAIKYMKQLQETAKTLEEQTTNKTMESIVIVNKSHFYTEDESSSDETSPRGFIESLPEIEVKLCDKIVLLKIHCEKHKGVLVKVLSKIENMNMSVAKTSVLSFGTLALDITIIAEMEKEFNKTIKDIVRSIRSALLGVI